MEQQVSNLVNFFEQKRNMNRRNAQIAQHRRNRSENVGRLLSLDGTFDGAIMPQLQQLAQHYQSNQIPATPHKQARYGYPITPQSIRRSGAPQTLTIPIQNVFPTQQSVYAPTASLNNSPTFADFPHMPSSADRASFPDINSPTLQNITPATSSHRGHARNNSTISIASSIGSAGALFFPDSGIQFSEYGIGYAPHPGAQSTSPKKRKSPSKSPSKGKDRPNFLDKAIMRNTGVTQEQINMYIGDPVAPDPKNWRCLWDGCTHLAARKENIRAHVQTHLGDRPYECPECHADFVRSHDFTRHYTTHVDSRDFKCPDCPQAFNRADALQRHRDRDFCNGLPPGSPTKVRRVIDAIDKKKDTAGRRSKKQTARKRTTKRQESADLSDDFWSSSGGSPEYFPSDTGSPEMILDGLVDDMPNNSQQTYVPMEQTTFSNSGLEQGEEALERIFAALSEENSASSQTKSLSPPMSPHQTHQSLPPFSPTPRRADKKQHEMTPPASRDSMLEFLNAPSIPGAQTVSSAPSLPDLSSTSTSPLAFEPVTDFEEFCNSMNASNDESWLDQRCSKGQAEPTFDFGAMIDSRDSAPAWFDTTEDLFGQI